LWRGSIVGDTGMQEPSPECLFVYLCVHAVGHSFERAEWLENAHRAQALVQDWDAVRHIARESRVVRAVSAVLDNGRSLSSQPVLDGWHGSLVWWSTWLVRGHWLPRAAR